MRPQLQRLVRYACLATLVLSSLRVSAKHESHWISLAGQHPFTRDDDPAFAARDFDDSAWRQIDVPGAWQTHGAGDLFDIGWYRLRVRIPAGWESRRLAVSLGFVGNASEVFLNGTKIGGLGSMDPVLYPGGRTVSVFELPAEHIAFGEDNLIAVRVMNQLGAGGLVSGPIGIGDYAELVLLARDLTDPRKAISWILAHIFGLMGGVSLLFAVRTRGDPFHAWLTVFHFLVCFLYLGSLFYLPTSGEVFEIWHRIIWAWSWLTPVVLTLVAMHGFQCYHEGVARVLEWSAVPISALLYQYGVEAPWYRLVNQLYGIAFLMFLVGCAWMAVGGWRRKVPNAIPIACGFAFILLGSTADMLGPLSPVYSYASATVIGWEIGFFLFLPVMAYASINSFLHGQNRLKELSRKVLSEREEERARLARDLHDSVGQSMQALKWMIQMEGDGGGASKPKSGDGFESRAAIVEHVSSCIEELRMVAREVHPELPDERNLGAAMSTYAEQMEKRLGVTITVESPEDEFRLPSDVAAHLYLTFKEAVGNAVRHGKAEVVEARLQHTPDSVTLSIRDDGAGFDEHDVQRGLGLTSIRERMELLYGEVVVQGNPGRGAYIQASLRLPPA